MNIHPPKIITSRDGLGLNTEKSIVRHGPDRATTTEIWPALETPWQESGTVIAQEGYIWKSDWAAGAHFVTTKIYDATGKFVATYIDICQPVTLTNGVFSFTDMYLDVWQPAGENPILLDEDELAAAVARGFVSTEAAEAAKGAAKSLLRG